MHNKQIVTIFSIFPTANDMTNIVTLFDIMRQKPFKLAKYEVCNSQKLDTYSHRRSSFDAIIIIYHIPRNTYFSLN